MAFFDKLSETITTKGKDVAKKTKDFAEISSLNSQINSQDDIIQEAYREIGRNYFEAHRDVQDDLYADQLSKIIQAMAVIEEKKQKIREVKGIKCCTGCGEEIPLGSVFCPKCGNKAEETVVDDVMEETSTATEAEAPKCCPKCNVQLEEGATFCTVCGERIE